MRQVSTQRELPASQVSLALRHATRTCPRFQSYPGQLPPESVNMSDGCVRSSCDRASDLRMAVRCCESYASSGQSLKASSVGVGLSPPSMAVKSAVEYSGTGTQAGGASQFTLTWSPAPSKKRTMTASIGLLAHRAESQAFWKGGADAKTAE